MAAGAGGLLVGQASAGRALAQSSRLPNFGAQRHLPIVFVHGNGDTAGLWLTTQWRFESNDYPAELLAAVDLEYPQARAVDAVSQPGRSSTDDVMRQVAREVAAVRLATGAEKVILVGQSRGGNTVRNYIKHGGGAQHTALAILCGAPSRGVINSDKFLVGSEFNGASPFLTALNSPPLIPEGVRMATIYSAENDKFAQPDGRHLGLPAVLTGVPFNGPTVEGAENIALPLVDHRETGFGSAAFNALHGLITGKAPTSDVTPETRVVLDGKVSGFEAGVQTNIAVAGARVTVFRIDAATGVRLSDAMHQKTTGWDGHWGPFETTPDSVHEFAIEVPGAPITHMYRSPFPRSSTLVNLRPAILVRGDTDAGSVVILARPRGYFGRDRGDIITFDGVDAPGIPRGVPTVSVSRLQLPEGPQRTVVGRFKGLDRDEQIPARTWAMKENRVSLIELTW